MGASGEKKQAKLDHEGSGDKGRRAYPQSLHRVHLKGPEDVRRLLSSVINDLRQQRIDPLVSGKIVYACQTLLAVFEQNTLIEKDRRA